MSLKDNLPNFIAYEKYTEEILNAIEPEIENLKLRLAKILLECCVTTASYDGVSRFEKDYALSYTADFTLEDRKRQIINKMLAGKCLTREEFANFVKRNVDETQFYISNSADEYKFEIMLADDSYKEELYNALSEARPAHLIFNITLVSYERRCGTFNCSGMVII
ncbi:MAG: YmfQ family protein [Candidatus Gastranaerophilales bacterium]|nr:YmfQ family protein [Candidatus Gastranaerophilales bacterium]